MRRTIQKQQRSLDDGNKDKGWHEWHIGGGGNVPDAGCAIMVIANGTVVLVMVHDAKHKRHA